MRKHDGPAIRVNNLVASYDDTIILDNVSLDVPFGETLVILGGSGCGKSTLLRHIIGLLQPREGSIELFGQNITDMDEHGRDIVRKRFGMLFQGSALFNSMTVGENVSLPLKEHTKLDDHVIRIMTRIKLELVGLSGFDDLMPAELSGGMKKRAALARAMAMDPEILFFDEPSAGLDPIVAAGIDDLIASLKSSFHMTQVVVTHEMGSAFRIADKMLMLHAGKVIFHGTPEGLKASDHPRIVQFLEGRAESEAADSEDYFNSLIKD